MTALAIDLPITLPHRPCHPHASSRLQWRSSPHGTCRDTSEGAHRRFGPACRALAPRALQWREIRPRYAWSALSSAGCARSATARDSATQGPAGEERDSRAVPQGTASGEHGPPSEKKASRMGSQMPMETIALLLNAASGGFNCFDACEDLVSKFSPLCSLNWSPRQQNAYVVV